MSEERASTRAGPVIVVEHASKKFCRTLRRSLWYGLRDLTDELVGRRTVCSLLRRDEFWAVRDISFEVHRGESLGVIGRNGAGKSTLLRLVSGRLKLDEGRITIRCRMGVVTELGAGFNPVQSGRENIYNNAAVLGMPRRVADALFDEIVEFAELDDFIDMPVQHYSAGMRARLGYAVVAHLRPDVLLVDEALAVGDIGFRRKCLNHMSNYVARGGSLVLVSHDLYTLQSICTRAVLMEEGRVVFSGSAVDALGAYCEVLRGGLGEVAGVRNRAIGLRENQCRAEQPCPPPPFASAGSQATSADPRGPGLASHAGHRAPELCERNPVLVDGLVIEPVTGASLKTGEPAVVTLRYRSLRANQPVVWGFTIGTVDQFVQISSALTGFGGENVVLAGGTGSLCCTIPRLPLAAGKYAIKAGIAERDTRSPIATIGWEDLPTIFSVEAAVSEVNNIRASIGDLVVMDVVWHDDGGTSS